MRLILNFFRDVTFDADAHESCRLFAIRDDPKQRKLLPIHPSAPLTLKAQRDLKLVEKMCIDPFFGLSLRSLLSLRLSTCAAGDPRAHSLLRILSPRESTLEAN